MCVCVFQHHCVTGRYMLQQTTNLHKSSGALFFLIEVCFHVSEEMGHPPKVLTFHVPIDAKKKKRRIAPDSGHEDAQSEGTRAFVDSASFQASLRSLNIHDHWVCWQL